MGTFEGLCKVLQMLGLHPAAGGVTRVEGTQGTGAGNYLGLVVCPLGAGCTRTEVSCSTHTNLVQRSVLQELSRHNTLSLQAGVAPAGGCYLGHCLVPVEEQFSAAQWVHVSARARLRFSCLLLAVLASLSATRKTKSG